MHYKKTGREKILSNRFFLSREVLESIEFLSAYFHTSPSVIAEFALKNNKERNNGTASKTTTAQIWQIKRKKVFIPQRQAKRTFKAKQNQCYHAELLPYFASERAFKHASAREPIF